MALDFAIVNLEGNIYRNVPIKIELHGEIFDKMKYDKFRLLEKIRDYYSDVIYTSADLVALKEELTLLAESHSSNTEHLKLLHSMIQLIDEASSRDLQIEVIAD